MKLKFTITFFAISQLFFAHLLLAVPDTPILITDFEDRRRAIAETMEKATVFIVVEDADGGFSMGTGFIVGNGYVLTNGHVVNDISKKGRIFIVNDNIPARRAKIVAVEYDKRSKTLGSKDLALLSFSQKTTESFPSLVYNLEPRRLDRVFAWGYPGLVTKNDISTQGLRNGDIDALKAPPLVTTEGITNAIVVPKKNIPQVVVHSAQIAKGNSGGPLINGHGEVVGINTWVYSERNEDAFFNMAQSSSTIVQFLQEHGVTVLLAQGQRLLTPTGPRSPTTPVFTPEDAEKLAKEPSLALANFAGQNKGKRRDVGNFSLEVPEGWSVIEEDPNKGGIILTEDGVSILNVTVREKGNFEISDLAKIYSFGFRGSRPKKGVNRYIFSFSNANNNYSAIVKSLNSRMYMIVIYTTDLKVDAINRVMNSVRLVTHS
ncbi:MAG: serine protease [Deltaproteobacteria bacterium]|jgi:S1-C subfamily serine protease|nr:serine protease [Deltaproteobacteria bacterium]